MCKCCPLIFFHKPFLPSVYVPLFEDIFILLAIGFYLIIKTFSGINIGIVPLYNLKSKQWRLDNIHHCCTFEILIVIGYEIYEQRWGMCVFLQEYMCGQIWSGTFATYGYTCDFKKKLIYSNKTSVWL